MDKVFLWNEFIRWSFLRINLMTGLSIFYFQKRLDQKSPKILLFHSLVYEHFCQSFDCISVYINKIIIAAMKHHTGQT